MLVVFVNGAAAHAILDPAASRRWGAAALGSVIVTLIYGGVRLATLPTEAGPVVGIVQPNISQSVKDVGKFDPHEDRRIFDKHVRMTQELVARSPDVALVVWPESVLQRGLYYHPRSDRWLHTYRFDLMAESVRSIGRPLIAGVLVGDLLRPGDKSTPEADLVVNLDFEKEIEATNSALLFDAEGGVRSRYDKIRLVQFTEAMPFEPLIPVKWIVAQFLKVSKVYEFRPGIGPAVFDIAGRTFGVCVCSENFYPDIWREIAGKGASAIVNISNEAWFRESAELDLMAAMAKFRAVENRTAVVRATNSGISAVLDSGGRVIGTIEGPGGDRKSVEGTMAVGVPAGRGGTVYGKIGDAAVWMAAGAALAGLAVSAFFSKR
jgi:apolipoprotein N-acyltransferase